MATRFIHGNCLDLLPTLPAQSVQAVVTSPPYFGLRSYLEHMDPNKAHEIGTEATPDEYVASLVAVFRELRRVLRDDGIAWLNLGSSYAPRQMESAQYGTIKPKDDIGIPWMVYFALRADGWYARRDIIWSKGSCMPESVRDRCTSSHEYVFMLTKRAQYYYDAVAIEEDGTIPAGTKAANGSAERYALDGVNSRPPEYKEYSGKRNKRSVWHINATPFPGSHFATMPPEMAETCIKAATSERGQCPTCGAPWGRVTQTEYKHHAKWFGDKQAARHSRGSAGVGYNEPIGKTTTGWQPTCACPKHTPVPQTVLDPFSGAGTTALCADRLGRNGIGIDLNAHYAVMARNRVYDDAPLFADIL